jgi:hypothetical protein
MDRMSAVSFTVLSFVMVLLLKAQDGIWFLILAHCGYVMLCFIHKKIEKILCIIGN